MREKLPVFAWNHETIFDEKTIVQKIHGTFIFFSLIRTVYLNSYPAYTNCIMKSFSLPLQFLFQYFPPLLIKILLSDEQKMCTRKNANERWMN